MSLDRDSDFDINTWLNGQGSNLLDQGGWSFQVNVSLVDSHFIMFPGLGTFTIRSLSGCNGERLGWHSDRTLLVDTFSSSVSDD